MGWDSILVGTYILDQREGGYFPLLRHICQPSNVANLQCLLSSPEVEHILDRVHDMIQSVLSEQPPCPTFRRGLSALLTLRKHEEIKSGWADIPHAFNTDCTRGWERIYQPDDLLIFHEHIRDASYSWLCRILAGGVEMNGSFLADGTVYTDLALLYSQVHEWHAER